MSNLCGTFSSFGGSHHFCSLWHSLQPSTCLQFPGRYSEQLGRCQAIPCISIGSCSAEHLKHHITHPGVWHVTLSHPFFWNGSLQPGHWAISPSPSNCFRSSIFSWVWTNWQRFWSWLWPICCLHDLQICTKHFGHCLLRYSPSIWNCSLHCLFGHVIIPGISTASLAEYLAYSASPSKWCSRRFG